MSKNETMNSELNNQIKQMIETLANAGYLSAPNTPATLDTTQEIRSELKKDENGKVKQTYANCLLILRNDSLFQNAFRFNEHSLLIEVVRNLDWKRDSISFSDNDLDHIIIYLENGYGICAEKKIERAVRVVARENSYHPIREKLLSLHWDGTTRVVNTLHHFLGAEESRFVAESLKTFMLGAVARVFYPGCKFDLMLCLVGSQGAGKSTFLRFLAMEDQFFTDDIKKLDDKKIFENLRGHWIIEMPEMLAILNAKIVEETKSFISRQSDIYRTPYDKFSADHPRQCVFAGTSNKTQFLPMDKSGNRRFLPIEVHSENAECHILDDESSSRAYIEQLWAEIMVIFQSGEYSLTLPKDLEKDLQSAQENHIPEDPIEIAIRNYLDEKHPEYVCVRMIYHEALNHPETDTPAQWESNAIGEIMDQKMTEYQKISSHRFPIYGTQRAWVLRKEPDFHEIPETEKSTCPFQNTIL